MIQILALPAVMIVAAFAIRRWVRMPRLMALMAWVQVGVTGWVTRGWLACPSTPPLEVAGMRLDATSALFLMITTVVVASAFTHAVETLRHKTGPELTAFYGCAVLFLVTMDGVVAADNLGYLWICMEATTIVSAPLVAFDRTRPAIEAAWKYLMICSVAIAFAFFGTALLYSASQQVASLPEGTLSLSVLRAQALLLPHGLTRLAFVFMLLGYGTKAGLFPLHNWLPDAHSEAPAPASAILSGAMLNCALVPLWRMAGLLEAAGDGEFVRLSLLPMGVITVVTASLFLLRQHDVKRLLAYSSMENVGLMAVAAAVGSSTGFALLAVNHSLVKAALFLLSGDLVHEYGTKKLHELRGLLRAHPGPAAVLMLGAVAVAGTPPFGSFVAEWQILARVADAGYIPVLMALCLALAIAFIALSTHLGGMLFGEPRTSKAEPGPFWVPAALLGVSLVLGLLVTPGVFTLSQGLTR